MAFIKRDERLPLYRQIREEILEKISQGKWLPDTAIPTEAELTKQYGVAIGTIRKAVDTLVNDGLLYRSQGRGTFVRRPDFNTSLFRFFRQQPADGGFIVPESLILSKALQVPPEEAITALNLQANQLAIHLKRLRFLKGVVVLTEDIWLPEMLFANLVDIDSNEIGSLLYPFYEKHCGLLVASATETLTIECADDDTASALKIETGHPVAVIERLAFGFDKTPIEYRVSRGSADTFRYQIEIN